MLDIHMLVESYSATLWILLGLLGAAVVIRILLAALARFFKRKKGRDFEKRVAKAYEKEGYAVIPHGLQMGKRDMGIDIIATKGDELCLIQCKNWNEQSTRRIDHRHLKEFIGNTVLFLSRHPEYTKLLLRRIYATSHPLTDHSAKGVLRHHRDIIEHRLF